MISILEFIARLALAALLGSIIGLERSRGVRVTGLCTHTLVAVGSCLIMLIFALGFRHLHAFSQVIRDPSRVAAQVVSGIGFLGAGTIILRREVVKGLTTTASVWAVAALGLGVGGGLYLPAVFATAVTLFILTAVKPLVQRAEGQDSSECIEVDDETPVGNDELPTRGR